MHLNELQQSKRTRRWALAAGLALALTLVGCGGGNGGDPSPSPSPVIDSPTVGSSPEASPTVAPTWLKNLDEIEVSGEWGTEPTVDAPYPFLVETTMDKVIIEGTGPKVPSATATIEVEYLGINARTGEIFDASWLRGQSAVFPLAQLIPGFGKGVVDKPVGSRVAIAITSSEGYDPAGQPSVGIMPGDTLLFIVDILDSEVAGPSGETVAPPADAPQVTETDGVPKITIPDGLAEPTEVQTYQLVQGSGRELAAEDALTSHAVCTTWDGTEYYNDYAEAPVNDAASGGVHKVLFEALVGQKTGSRVLVVMPGSLAYPNGNPNENIEPNTSVACVVDVLFTQVYA